MCHCAEKKGPIINGKEYSLTVKLEICVIARIFDCDTQYIFPLCQESLVIHEQRDVKSGHMEPSHIQQKNGKAAAYHTYKTLF